MVVDSSDLIIRLHKQQRILMNCLNLAIDYEIYNHLIQKLIENNVLKYSYPIFQKNVS